MSLASRWLALACATLATACSSRGPASTPIDSDTPGVPVSTRSLTFVPLFEGACDQARIGHAGPHLAFILGTIAYWFDDKKLRVLYRPPTDGSAGIFALEEVGGIDAAHAWVTSAVPSRTHASVGQVLFAALDWKAPNPGPPGVRFFSIDRILENPDGSILVYEPSYPPTGTRFNAWSSRGTAVGGPLPKPQMRDVVRLASGELVDGDRDENHKVILRRWSPSRNLTDLVRDDSLPADSYVGERVGTQRVVLSTVLDGDNHAFYTYDGSSLDPVPIPGPVGPSTSWLVTQADTLFVASGSDLYVQAKGATVTNEAVPEPGELAQDPARAWWLGKSGTLYARDESGWVQVPLPAGPPSSPGAAPVRIEWVKTVGRETLLGTYRPAPGGDERSPYLRTVYSTVDHGKPLRCGAPHARNELAPAP